MPDTEANGDRQARGLNIPASSSTVKVSIIDTTTRISGIAADVCVEPRVGALTELNIPSLSFLIEHEGKCSKLLYDLGVPKDWANVLPGPVAQKVIDNKWKADVTKNVAEILQDCKVKINDVDAIVWSHWHWDHVGDPHTFPSTTALIVGPGFKSEFLPGWPTNPESRVHEKAFAERPLREISFDDAAGGLRIGGFEAYDYFGDGSFYLLNSPGHAIGHLSALARTTTGEAPTFIFMAGDAIHHDGEIRPSRQVQLPGEISPSPLILPRSSPQSVCCGDPFLAIHPTGSREQPFLRPSGGYNLEDCMKTIASLQELDAHEDVLCIMAHDSSMLEVAEFFPRTANNWKSKDWKRLSRWRFLADFLSQTDRQRLQA